MQPQEQYRNLDVGRWPQAVRFEFERETLDDNDPDLSWLEQDYGDVEEPEERERYREQDRQRLASYGDQWWMIGVRAKVTIWVPIGGTAFTRYELTSSGLWGVESDCGEDYLNELFEEQKAELVRALKLIGVAAAELDQ